MSTLAGLGKDALAAVVAADIPPGSFVNLGIALGHVLAGLSVIA